MQVEVRLVGFSLTATFSSIDQYSTSRVWGFGRSEMYISETASMFASVRDTVMLGTRPSNCTAVFWVLPNLEQFKI